MLLFATKCEPKGMTSPPRDPKPGWMLNELASAGRENLDPAHVSRYDLIEDADAHEEVELLVQLGMGPKSLLIDIGAGTGQFAIAASPFCGRVIAADISPAMLQALEAKLDAVRLDNVNVVKAGFLTYEHRGEPADFIYSR